MKHHSKFFCICAFLATAVFLPAQTAIEIEELLENEALNYERIVSFVLEAADFNGFSGPEEAFRFAGDKKWLPRNASPGGEATLEGVSLLIMQSFNIRGGIFYSLLNTPRYAYRELIYQDIIQGRADPEMKVSGDLLLFLVNRVLSLRETEDL